MLKENVVVKRGLVRVGTSGWKYKNWHGPFYPPGVTYKGDVAAALGNFFASGILRLGRQLGPLLWQLPAMVRFDAERAQNFFALLPRSMREAEDLAQGHDERTEGRAALAAPDGRGMKLRHALEVRHESWLSDQSLELMAKNNVALV